MEFKEKVFKNKVLRCEASIDAPVALILYEAKYWLGHIEGLSMVEVTYDDIIVNVDFDTTEEKFMEQYNNKLTEYHQQTSTFAIPKEKDGNQFTKEKKQRD